MQTPNTPIEFPDVHTCETSELAALETPAAQVVTDILAQLVEPEVKKKNYKRSIKQEMITGSYLQGNVESVNMSGHVQYTMPHGVMFTGPMKDGMFQGEGVLCYPTGAELHGTWDQGHLIRVNSYVYKDGLTRTLDIKDPERDFDYCTGEDRRMYQEVLDGMAPATEKALRTIPGMYYEVEDGYLDLSVNWVLHRDTLQPLRHAPAREITRAVRHCRRGWDEYTTNYGETFDGPEMSDIDDGQMSGKTHGGQLSSDKTSYDGQLSSGKTFDEQDMLGLVTDDGQMSIKTHGGQSLSDKTHGGQLLSDKTTYDGHMLSRMTYEGKVLSGIATDDGQVSIKTHGGQVLSDKTTYDGQSKQQQMSLETNEDTLINPITAYQNVPRLAALKKEYKRQRKLNILTYKINHHIASDEDLALYEKLKQAGVTLHAESIDEKLKQPGVTLNAGSSVASTEVLVGPVEVSQHYEKSLEKICPTLN